ncbi:MAG: RsmB/NOP family class I SAM-dependent RNA methyltransferase [Sphingobacteriaceae bacterium]
MRAEAHLRSFNKALEAYPADTPLAKFLPEYFRKHKEMGSGDRRRTSHLLYTYFRLGKACIQLPQEERLLLAEFLCSTTANEFLAHFRPDLADKIDWPLADKITLLEKESDFKLQDVFPFGMHLSEGIDTDEFLRSHFIQPDLFIRIHPGRETLVKAKLEQEGISYEELTQQTLALPNGTKLNHLFGEQNYFEVQDASSQQTAHYFQPAKWEAWWDACAASGGKSILLHQLEPTVKLLVSDIRESVLHNLEERFKANAIKNYQKKTIDLLQNPDPILHHYEFDGIILDAPCTGSGTWGRTPEMISQFAEHRIADFQNLQKSIVQNVVKYLKPGKPLIYITCSVFKEENEEMVKYLVSELGLRVEKQSLLKGYAHKADSMFVARLLKP